MIPSHQILQRVPSSVVDDIIQYLRNEERDVYKSALSTLATGRKLRPVFVQKRPLDKQLAWMAQSMQLKSGDAVAEQVLQVWLLKAKKDMLISFLDEVGIEHDGDGSVDELPETFDEAKLKAGVDKMLEDHTADEAKIYLYLFQTQRPGGWDELSKLLAEDDRLKLEEA